MRQRRRPPPRQRPLLEELEPRILFSAEAAAGLLDPNHWDGQAEVRLLEPAATPAAATNRVEAAQQRSHEIVFIDKRVPEWQVLVDDLVSHNDGSRQVEIFLLDPHRDGVEQIGQVLGQRQEIAAVHLISHGSAGSVELGSGTLNFDTLLTRATQIKGWGDAFTANADLLIYGCDVAATQDGQALITALSRLTGADVAASDDPTGAAALGGDWTLEYRAGAIETQIAPSAQAQQQWWWGTLATFTVTRADDTNSGGGGVSGDLRWAITQANGAGGADTINFNITGTGTHTIAPTSALPTITGQVTIDGTTDDSFAANSNRPAIIVAGTNAGIGVDGLVLTSTADGSTIRGLVVRDWGADGISIQAGSDNNFIVGNYIGRLTTTGTDAGAGTQNEGTGVYVAGANNTIGGTAAADRNVISGNDYGIELRGAGGTGNLVLGNYLGTDATGTVDIGNAFAGVGIGDAANNTVGGTGAAARNLISGNNEAGVELWGATTSGNRIVGNWIGLNASGAATLGNSWSGVWIITSAAGNVIGGTAAGSGNVIAGQTAGDGVELRNDAGANNAILGNSIYSNAESGIDLIDNGITANDAGDPDTGTNNLQNFPVLTSANSNAAGTTIVGTINSNANTTLRIEFFGNRPTVADTPNGEGERFLGAITVTTDGSGNASVNTTLADVWVNSGDRITATATVRPGRRQLRQHVRVRGQRHGQFHRDRRRGHRRRHHRRYDDLDCGPGQCTRRRRPHLAARGHPRHECHTERRHTGQDRLRHSRHGHEPRLLPRQRRCRVQRSRGHDPARFFDHRFRRQLHLRHRALLVQHRAERQRSPDQRGRDHRRLHPGRLLGVQGPDHRDQRSGCHRRRSERIHDPDERRDDPRAGDQPRP